MNDFEKEMLLEYLRDMTERGDETAKKLLPLLEKQDDEIAIVWSVEDVMQECDWLTREQALEVLNHLDHKHDATIGINWEVIYYNAQWMYPKENEDA